MGSKGGDWGGNEGTRWIPLSICGLLYDLEKSRKPRNTFGGSGCNSIQTIICNVIRWRPLGPSTVTVESLSFVARQSHSFIFNINSSSFANLLSSNSLALSQRSKPISYRGKRGCRFQSISEQLSPSSRLASVSEHNRGPIIFSEQVNHLPRTLSPNMALIFLLRVCNSCPCNRVAASPFKAIYINRIYLQKIPLMNSDLPTPRFQPNIHIRSHIICGRIQNSPSYVSSHPISDALTIFIHQSTWLVGGHLAFCHKTIFRRKTGF